MQYYTTRIVTYENNELYLFVPPGGTSNSNNGISQPRKNLAIHEKGKTNNCNHPIAELYEMWL